MIEISASPVVLFGTASINRAVDHYLDIAIFWCCVVVVSSQEECQVFNGHMRILALRDCLFQILVLGYCSECGIC